MNRDPFHAIADPIRRDIIMMVAKSPMTPNSLSENFDVSRQAISRHIKILTECGLLTVKIEGREYYYSIQPKKLKAIDDWLTPFRKLWDTRFGQLDNVLKNLKNK